ncbi:LysR substrate-binding domain-containing protein [Comamonas terrigena]|uniref:LysR family transcriptional regulator n=1 Tax=Comamonas terrigena TaxID=32013 RepID=A0A2A7UXV1_COMTR|nr:LysR substrate-binding domain-containing protein [Comamonas terrigena]PEH90001.1 LysR family transcriptional regulator [Comamonas terrigena]BBL25277.1 transcriptional regulator [Comamonas terrigena NBRC 13299]
MPTPLPLKSLAVFDAVMKHHSFTMAAAELHVTPGAVGQQIQKLEEWLGQPLFVRSIRQIQPTPEAQTYWAAVQPALARIQQASDQLRQLDAHQVWLSMPPTLAAKWFAPRMAAFLQRRPDISLHLSATTDMVDFERDRVDLAVRHFGGQAPGLQTELLYADSAHLYCAPGYAQRLGLHQPDDLSRATLLHTTLLPYWRDWLRRFSSLGDAQIAQLPSLHFDQSMLAIEAARHHQGVVLSSPLLVQQELRDGVLCEPLGLRMAVDKGYYLVSPRHTPLRPAAAALREWLLETAELEREAGADMRLRPETRPGV